MTNSVTSLGQLDIPHNKDPDETMGDANSIDIELHFPELKELDFWRLISNNPVGTMPDANTKEKHIRSIGLRLKSESLGRIVEVGCIQNISPDLVFGKDLNLSVSYEVISTLPKGEIRITDGTLVKVASMKFGE